MAISTPVTVQTRITGTRRSKRSGDGGGESLPRRHLGTPPVAPLTISAALGVSQVRDHAIFGGCLRSEIPLPELPPIQAAEPDWFFQRAAELPANGTYLGDDRVDADIRVRCSKLPDGFQLDFDDTGTFDVVDHGRRIAWTPGATTAMELVRADLLGGVFSVALHLQGLLCLHGSAVGIGETAVAFLANKGAGKSTLATAMCAAGATLITDDMLPVDPRTPVTAWPSMPAVRLLHDSASHLRYASGQTHPATNKYHVNELPPDQVEMRRLPLGAIYELAPVPAGPGVPIVERIRIKGTVAVGTLLRHHRAGTAIGGSESINLFVRASDIVRTVPVYRLQIARDFSRLPDVVSQIRDWHSADASADAAS